MTRKFLGTKILPKFRKCNFEQIGKIQGFFLVTTYNSPSSVQTQTFL
jgi:hypothetical protein